MSIERQLATILAADVVGYTRMMAEDHISTLDHLRKARDNIVEPMITEHNGSVIKRLGDGWLASFEHPGDAVRSATAIQDLLADSAFIKLRIGIHLGEVSFVDEDVFGSGVNIAARLEALAVAGGIAVSAVTLTDLEEGLLAEFNDAGTPSLKNVSEPVSVWTRGGLSNALNGDRDKSEATIAVEPFTVQGDLDQASLAEEFRAGLEIELSRFRWLKVMGEASLESKSSSRARYVLSGVWRGSGNRIRLSAHLSTTSDGQRIWSDRFDRLCDDPFALQDELASAVASVTATEIDAQEKALARVRPIELLNATELSLRTNEILSAGRLESFAEADAMMARAVALEPQNASAHVQRSLVNCRKAMSGAWPADVALAQALEAAHEAVRIDRRLPSGHVMLAVTHGMRGEVEPALDAAAEVAALNPNAWGAYHARSIAYAFAPPSWASEHDPSAQSLLDDANETVRLASASAFRSGHLFYAGLGHMLRCHTGDLDLATSQLDKSASALGATWWPHLFLALVKLRQGALPDAAEHVHHAVQKFPLLNLEVVKGIFGQSRIWPIWLVEFHRLAEVGLAGE